ncbi:MAG: class I SAM-dependent methyltransferase [Actinomycetota bacterium]|nr:class I SAM-dependent methyltransferase [Actinomycetota bacterium]
MDAEFWQARYQQSQRIWSGAPNPQLAAEASGLGPGKAIDVGCGEGADAIWLANRGWMVTAVDFAQAALDKGEAEAQRQGLSDNIAWICEDLASWQPPREYTLASAQFFHLEPTLRDAALRHLAASVVTGGTLLVVGHNRQDLKTHTGHERHADVLFDAGDIESLLDHDEWKIVLSEARERVITDDEGKPFIYIDSVMRAVRI